MHIKILEGAEINGHRPKAGTVLDLPEEEARPLIKAKLAEPLDVEAEPGQLRQPGPVVAAKASRPGKD